MASKHVKRTHIIAKYNERGYWIETTGGDVLYTAGNHRLESQIWVDPDDSNAVDLATVKEFAETTANEMVGDNLGYVFVGADYQREDEMITPLDTM